MKIWYSLLCIMAVFVLSSCQSTTPKDNNTVRIAYRQAFEKFANTSFRPTYIHNNSYLITSPQISANLTQMAKDIAQTSSKYGTLANISIINKRGRDNSILPQIEKIFSNKFNPLAQEISNNQREFAYLLASSGYAYRNTGFAEGNGNGQNFKKIYIVATLINANCGMFSCFSDFEQQIEWKLVYVNEAYLATDKNLRLAQVAANNYEFLQAERYFSLSKNATGSQKVKKEIDRIKSDFNRKKQNKITTEKNVAYWQNYDKNHKGKSNTAILLSGLMQANEIMAETGRITANAKLTTAIATQNAYNTKKLNSITQQNNQMVYTQNISHKTAVSDNAYKKQYYTLQAMNNAYIEKYALYKIKFNLTDLYQDAEEGKVFRATIDRAIDLAEKDYTTSKSKFDSLVSDTKHQQQVDDYINQDPEKSAKLNLGVDSSKIEKRYNELKNDYKHFYIKDKNLYKK